MELEFNEYQTKVTKEDLEAMPKEVSEQFIDFINNVPLIKRFIAKDRKYARDLERNDDGKIIVDITHPHILEDMDYFRPSALHYKKYGRYTNLSPNPNPNSEYGKWIREEIRRCYDGYIRPSDGEWITGDYYFFLNYCPILLSEKDDSNNEGKKGNKKKANRIIDFPYVWEGHYYLSHYLEQARINGHHGCMLARRGAGKSFFGASRLAKRFILGESLSVNKKVQCVVTASEKKYIIGANQVLDMFQYYIDFCANNTQFPANRIENSAQNMKWTMGYIDQNNGTKKGTLNSVMGITSKDDESKLIGSRGQLYLIEEMGSFPKLKGMYARLRPSVEDGDNVFGQIYMYGTAGDDDSNFSSAQEIMYNPRGYNMQEIDNVYDKEGQGRKYFTFFFPSYLNRANCYDNNGNSDVTKALLETLNDRYIVKYNTTDINAITKRISEFPITPAEAILKANRNLFPITEINERINQIDNNPSFYDDTYIGTLVSKDDGSVDFLPTNEIPIREFPLNNNKADGALEVYQMPKKGADGKIQLGRYIMGLDPVDDDESNTLSLFSVFVLDLFTDEIVAEYTGRKPLADDNFEIVRKLCIFYNAQCLYENNKKGIYSYFSQRNCLYMLAETPEYLKDKDLIKVIGIGNKSRGVNATLGINNYANRLIQQWLIKPVPLIVKEDGEDREITIANLYKIKSRALLLELSKYNPDINVDRIRALGMVMLFREEKMIMYQGDINNATKDVEKDYLGNDDFFSRNYDNKFKNRNFINNSTEQSFSDFVSKHF